MSLGETLQLLSPELILLFTGLAVLCVDFIWQGDASAEEKKTLWVPGLALAGVGLVLLLDRTERRRRRAPATRD